MDTHELQEIDKVEITVLADNYSDLFLSDTDMAKRMVILPPSGPMHCTGWHAINRFSREMPDKFILNSVGTTYIF